MYDYERRSYGYFTPLFNPQSYKNLAYMFMSFPLGLIYFIGLVLGFSLGFGLLVIIVGIPILLATLAISWMAVGFERVLANNLLDTDIPVLSGVDLSGSEGWRKNLLSFSNWKGIGYLFAKFPFGILSFVMAVLTLALPLGMLAAPLTYAAVDYTIMGASITSFPAAMVAFIIGLVIAPVILFFNNRLMDGWRAFTVAMLTPTAREAQSLEKAKRDQYTGGRRQVTIPDGMTPDYGYDEPNYDYDKPKRRISDLLDEPDSSDYSAPQTNADSRPSTKSKRKTLSELLAEDDE